MQGVAGAQCGWSEERGQTEVWDTMVPSRVGFGGQGGTLTFTLREREGHGRALSRAGTGSEVGLTRITWWLC